MNKFIDSLANKLTPKERLVFYPILYQGLSIAELAEFLEKSEATIKMQRSSILLKTGYESTTKLQAAVLQSYVSPKYLGK